MRRNSLHFSSSIPTTKDTPPSPNEFFSWNAGAPAGGYLRVILRGFVRAGAKSGCNRQAVPGFDRRYRQCKVGQLFLVKVDARFVVHRVRNMPVCDLCHRLGPSQGRPLAVAIVRTLAPCVERIETLLFLAHSTK